MDGLGEGILRGEERKVDTHQLNDMNRHCFCISHTWHVFVVRLSGLRLLFISVLVMEVNGLRSPSLGHSTCEDTRNSTLHDLLPCIVVS